MSPKIKTFLVILLFTPIIFNSCHEPDIIGPTYIKREFVSISESSELTELKSILEKKDKNGRIEDAVTDRAIWSNVYRVYNKKSDQINYTIPLISNRSYGFDNLNYNR